MPRGTPKPSPLLVGTLAASMRRFDSLSVASNDAMADGVAHAVESFARAWFEGDEEGMAQCLHPDLMTSLLQAGTGPIPPSPVQSLSRLQGIHVCLGTRVPMERRRCEISILDVQGHAASVRAHLGDWVAYVHLVQLNDRWTIVNVMWEWLSNRSA